MKEPTRWAARYLIYRDLGPDRRLVTVYQMSGGKELSPPPLWFDIFERWQWRERAQAWDRQKVVAAQEQAAQVRDRERAERVLLLKAGRAKLVTELNQMTPTSDNLTEILSGISTVTSQLRAEQGD